MQQSLSVQSFSSLDVEPPTSLEYRPLEGSDAALIRYPQPQASASSSSSCFGRVCSRLSSIIHSPAGSSLITIASTIGLIASNTVFPSAPLSVVSSLAFGYFGQTVASHIKQSSDSEAMKGTSLGIKRVQQHASLATMMIAGYYQEKWWAPIINCVLAGMSVRLKIKNFGEFPPSSRNHEELKRLPLVLGVISACTCAIGLYSMNSFSLFGAPRKLTLAIAAAEYGIKGLGVALGFQAERLLEANRQSSACLSIQKALSLVENIGIGACVYSHGHLLTNARALGFVFPLGFFLGTNISRMHRLSQIEQDIMDASDLDPGISRISVPSIVLHAFTIDLFAVIGLYYILNWDEDTIGFDVFFPLVPVIYGITRFIFSQRQSHNSRIQKMGHFLLQKSALTLSTELNYGMSFVFAGAVKPTDTNARIFYVFQALLFGSTQAALFAIDEEENLSFSLQGQKRQILRKCRVASTSNFARIDILINTLSHTFREIV